MFDRLEGDQTRIANYLRSSINESQTKLRKAVAIVREKVDGLPELLHKSDQDFVTKMQQLYREVAKLQAAIGSEVSRTDSFCVAPVSLGLDSKLKTEALELSTKIQYFVAVYTALVFYRIADTWSSKPQTGWKTKSL